MPGKTVYIPIFIAADDIYKTSFQPVESAPKTDELVLSAKQIEQGDAEQIAKALNERITKDPKVFVAQNPQDQFDMLFLQKAWNLRHPGVFMLTLELEDTQMGQIEIKSFISRYNQSIERPITRVFINGSIKADQIKDFTERVQLCKKDDGLYLPKSVNLTYPQSPACSPSLSL